MSTPPPEVDIPETSAMRLVCNACLGTKWVGESRAPSDTHVEGWHCGDCGHHRALLIRTDEWERMKAERGAAAD